MVAQAIDRRGTLRNATAMKNTFSITTRTGDKGTTHLFSGETISKHSQQTDAYGDLDEVVSLLGMARAASERAALQETLISLQRRLFVVGTELATSLGHVQQLAQRVDAAMVAELDRERDALEERLPPVTDFILPGGTEVAAHLDLARAVTRRCERKVVGLLEAGLVENADIVVWLNRLSDYLWLLAREEEGEAVLMKNASMR